MTTSTLQYVEIQSEQVLIDSRLLADRMSISFEYLEELMIGVWGESLSYITVYDLLALWQHTSFLEEGLPEVSNVLDELYYNNYLSHQQMRTIQRLKLSVVTDIALNVKAKASEFGRVHQWFKKNYKQYLPDCHLIKVFSIKGKRPDFLIKKSNIIYPVECKLSFNKTSLLQLKGYMDLWQVSIGYAVSPKLVCDLPNNVIHIQSP